MKGYKIYTNGTMELYDIHEEKYEANYIALQKSIDCGCIDIVHARYLPSPYCMVVDDEGLFVEKPTVNLFASYLYGTHEHGQPIVGDVIIMRDQATPDGIETVGLDEKDANRILDIFIEKGAVGVSEVIEKLKLTLGGDE